MELEEKTKLFKQIIDSMLQTYEKKQHDYGDSFSKSIDQFGYLAGVVRISDKYNRIVSLLSDNEKAKVLDESVDDTLLDLANYAVMLLVERNARRTLQ